MIKRNLSANDICNIIEKEVPGTKCTISPTIDQIAVQFSNRPGIVIHLLSPYYQLQLKKNCISEEDISQLISEVRKISEREVYTDAIIEDIQLFLSSQEKRYQ